MGIFRLRNGDRITKTFKLELPNGENCYIGLRGKYCRNEFGKESMEDITMSEPEKKLLVSAVLESLQNDEGWFE